MIIFSLKDTSNIHEAVLIVILLVAVKEPMMAAEIIPPSTIQQIIEKNIHNRQHAEKRLINLSISFSFIINCLPCFFIFMASTTFLFRLMLIPQNINELISIEKNFIK